MKLYLDVSVLIAALTDDILSDRATALLASNTGELLVSDFGQAEFASGVARRVRTGELSRDEARAAFAHLDRWCATATSLVRISPDDVGWAAAIVRKLDFNLRTPDALHIAIARRLGAALGTLDRRMGEAASGLGLTVAPS